MDVTFADGRDRHFYPRLTPRQVPGGQIHAASLDNTTFVNDGCIVFTV